MHLGYGRTRAGRVGNGTGFNANKLRTSAAPWFGRGLVVKKTGERATLACTQDHWSIDETANVAAKERHLVRTASLAEYEKDPHVVPGHGPRPRAGAEPLRAGATSTRATPGACRSTSTPASAATPASWPASPRTTSPWWARTRWAAAARCTGSASTATTRAPRRDPTDPPPARRLHALRERPLRGRLPGGRHRAQRRGAERHGLQPLRGHAVLLQQLPLQGAALQLLPLPGLDHPEPQDDAQPRRDACAAAGSWRSAPTASQRINRERIDAKNEGRAIKDGEIETACERRARPRPSSSGTSTTRRARSRSARPSRRTTACSTELQTRPRTTYLAAVKNPNPEMPGAATEADHG